MQNTSFSLIPKPTEFKAKKSSWSFFKRNDHLHITFVLHKNDIKMETLTTMLSSVTNDVLTAEMIDSLILKDNIQTSKRANTWENLSTTAKKMETLWNSENYPNPVNPSMTNAMTWNDMNGKNTVSSTISGGTSVNPSGEDVTPITLPSPLLKTLNSEQLDQLYLNLLTTTGKGL